MASEVLPTPQSGVALSIVVPVFNEERTIRELLAAVLAVPVEPKEVIVVDDCSTDGTLQALQELASLHPRLRILMQPRNQGKGGALHAGFAATRGAIVVVQDADLEYDPREIPRLLQPIERGEADVVYGSRFLGPNRSAASPVQRWGNWLLTKLSNATTGLRLTDMETCYKVFRGDLLRSLPLRQQRFGFEPEVTAKIARRSWRVVEVPVSFQPRSYAEGKKIGWLDLLNAVWCIGRYAFND
jgi:glycosyltransferase involved in cell wall biosynthesis